MSGLVGECTVAGAALSRQVLEAMTAAMAYRAPQGRHCWLADTVGLGHAHLRQHRLDPAPRQPFALEEGLWITADARVDDRATLVARLVAQGRPVTVACADAELLLHAYAVWGTDCPRHLLGDFAFGIWDAARQRLFCARDHLGVKPFYYADLGDRLVFGNTLDSLRLRPDIPTSLDELALADFLVYGYPLDPAATSFRAIRCLPPAHTLVWQDGRTQVQRYWALSTQPLAAPQPDRDAPERFRALLDAAVTDRLRADSVAISLSGGLDSTSVAASACGALAAGRADCDLAAYTVVYDRQPTDSERVWAGLAARHLGLPTEFMPGDDFADYQGWLDPDLCLPLPTFWSEFAQERAIKTRLVERGVTVCLSGHGGDFLLFPERSQLALAARSGQVARLPLDLARFVGRTRQWPPLYLRSALRARLRPGSAMPAQPLPDWLDQDLVAEHGLRERYRSYYHVDEAAHPLRPRGYWELTRIGVARSFEKHDPGRTGWPIETRYPFFDIRLVEFALSLRPFPWCVRKHLLREAMVGRLPEALRRRRKTPLGEWRTPLAPWLANPMPVAPELRRFLRPAALDRLVTVANGQVVDMLDEPFMLNFWLQHCRRPAEPAGAVPA